MRSSKVQRLFDAAAVGNVVLLKGLLDAGAPVNARSPHGRTPLIIACQAGRLNAVNLLLSRGARLDVRTDPLFGLSEPFTVQDLRHSFEQALASAVVHSNAPATPATPSPEVVDAFELLENTEDLLAEAGPLLTAAVCGHVPIVNALLRAGASANALDWMETPPLVGAAAQGHVRVVSLLLDAGADVDAGTGFTALEEAVLHEHDEVINALLEAGADVDRRNEDGATALMLAASTGHLPIVRRLVEAGADVDIIADGDSALTCAAQYGHLGVYAYLLPRSEPAIQAQGDRALCDYLDYVARL